MFSTISKNIIFSLVVFLVIFTPLAFGTTEPWSILVFELVSALMAILWFLKAYTEKSFTIAKTASTPNSKSIFSNYALYILPILFIILIMFQLVPIPAVLLKTISINTYNIQNSAFDFIQQSPHFALSLNTNATFQELLKYLCLFIVFFVTINEIKTFKQINAIFSVIFGLGFLISIFAIIQKFSWTGKIYGLKPIPARCGVFGPFVNYDHYGGYMNMAVMAGFGLILSNIQASKKMLAGFMLVVMVVSLFISASRGAVLSLLGSLLFMLFLLFALRKSYEKKLLVSAILVLSSMALMVVLMIYWIDLATALGRMKGFLKLEGNFFNPRLDIWRDSFEIAKSFPIFGTGIGTYEFAFPMFQVSYTNLFWKYAHNDYLQLLTEAGPTAILLVVLMLLTYFKKVFIKIKNSRNDHLIGLLAGCATAVFTMLLHSIVDFNLHIPSNAFLFTLLAGLSISLTNISGDKNPSIEVQQSEAESFPRTGRVKIHSLAVLLKNVAAKLALPWRLLSSFSRASSVATITIQYQRRESIFISVSVFAGILCTIIFIITPSVKYYFAHIYFEKALAAPEISSFKKAISFSPSNAAYRQAYAIYAQKIAATISLPAEERSIYLSISKNELEKAIVLSPAEAKYWASCAWLCGNLNEKEKAESAFQIALSLAPNNKNIKTLYSQFQKSFSYH